MERPFTDRLSPEMSTPVLSACMGENRGVAIRFADAEIDAEAHELRRSGDLIDVPPPLSR